MLSVTGSPSFWCYCPTDPKSDLCNYELSVLLIRNRFLPQPPQPVRLPSVTTNILGGLPVLFAPKNLAQLFLKFLSSGNTHLVLSQFYWEPLVLNSAVFFDPWFSAVQGDSESLRTRRVCVQTAKDILCNPVLGHCKGQVVGPRSY